MSEESVPHRGISRRSFLKTSAAITGAAAVGGESMSALAETQVPEVEEKTYYNNCRGNCGYNNCILEGVVREGRLVQCKPIYPNHDYPFWKTGCVKGQVNPQRIYAEDRVLYPLKRVGARGAGEWQRVSWDEAMTDIANKMLDAQKNYGDASVGFWHGFSAGGILNRCLSVIPCRPRGGIGIGFERFIFKSGATVLTPSADMAVIYGVWELLGLGNEDSISMRDSRTILVWGFNPSESGRAEFGYIRDAQEKGATVITIDPRFTRTASISDMWLPIRPGTDGLLALAMCNYVLDNNLIDEDFLANQSVAPFLIKEDGKYLRLSDLAVPAEEGAEEPAPDPAAENSQVVYDPATGTFVSHRVAVNPALHGAYEVNGI